MSKYSTFDKKFRSFSPQYFSDSPSDTESLFEKHRNLIHKQVSELPNSPRSKEKIEKTFEEMLKSIHFFRKPDIIPFPYLSFNKHEEKVENFEYQSLANELENEKNLRKTAEKEVYALKEKLLYLLEIEKQYEEYRLKSFKVAEMQSEIDKLNVRIRLLLEENEDMRRKAAKSIDYTNYKYQQEYDANKNSQLLKELKDLREANEELKKVYTRDVNS